MASRRAGCEVFQICFAAVLVPELRPGDIFVEDSLRPHKAPGIREALEAAGVELLFLPPYSRDCNPIELAFSEL